MARMLNNLSHLPMDYNESLSNSSVVKNLEDNSYLMGIQLLI